MKLIANPVRLLGLSALIVFLSVGFLPASQEGPGPSATPPTDIKFSFKMDQRITRGMYMGDIWVSPPTYVRVGEGKECTVGVRAEVQDANGKRVDLSPEWIPADPEMVTVSSGHGQEINITVRRAGQSSLKVASAGVSKELIIKASYEGSVIKVEITGAQTSPMVEQRVKEETKRLKEKLSYSLGYETGRSMKNNSVDLDPEVYGKAFREGLAGNQAAMTDQEMGALVQGLQRKMAARQPDKKKELAEKNKQIDERNRAEGEAFLAENAKKEGVITLPSGLQYKIIREGTGGSPRESDQVEVHYRGSLISGAEFDSSYKRGKPAVFAVNKTIKGFTEALQLMKEGAKWTLYIPSGLAYGARGAGRGKIGPNQTLVFEVELISIRSDRDQTLSVLRSEK